MLSQLSEKSNNQKSNLSVHDQTALDETESTVTKYLEDLLLSDDEDHTSKTNSAYQVNGNDDSSEQETGQADPKRQRTATLKLIPDSKLVTEHIRTTDGSNWLNSAPLTNLSLPFESLDSIWTPEKSKPRRRAITADSLHIAPRSLLGIQPKIGHVQETFELFGSRVTSRNESFPHVTESDSSIKMNLKESSTPRKNIQRRLSIHSPPFVQSEYAMSYYPMATPSRPLSCEDSNDFVPMASQTKQYLNTGLLTPAASRGSLDFHARRFSTPSCISEFPSQPLFDGRCNIEEELEDDIYADLYARGHGLSFSSCSSVSSFLALETHDMGQDDINKAFASKALVHRKGANGKEPKKVTLFKTEMCRSFEEGGECKYGSSCHFAHSDEELNEVNRHPRYKTEVCKTFYDSGACPYGKRCCFIHTREGQPMDINELRIVQAAEAYRLELSTEGPALADNTTKSKAGKRRQSRGQ